MLLFLFSSSWKEAYHKDEFGDDTNNSYLYTNSKGVFEKSNNKTPIFFKTIIDISGGVPQGSIIFEPIFNEESIFLEESKENVAIFKFKDEKENIITIENKNNEYGNKWNKITQGENVISLISLFMNNKKVKISIQYGSFSFYYTLECSNFKRAYNKFIDVYAKKEILTNEWKHLKNTSTVWLDPEDSDKNTYGFLRIIFLPDEKISLLMYAVLNKDSKTSLYYIPKSVEYNIITFSVQDKQCSFKTGGLSVLRLNGNSGYGAINKNILYPILKAGSTVKIKLETSLGSIITFSTSSSEIIKYIKDPY